MKGITLHSYLVSKPGKAFVVTCAKCGIKGLSSKRPKGEWLCPDCGGSDDAYQLTNTAKARQPNKAGSKHKTAYVPLTED